MKAITPIIAIVILLLMTIAAGGMAYLTVTTFQDEAGQGAQGSLQVLTAGTKTQIKIESVSGGNIYLRNMGTETYTGSTFYVNGRPINFTGPTDCESGKVCVYTLLENVTCDEECTLSMGEDMPIGTKLTA